MATTPEYIGLIGCWQVVAVLRETIPLATPQAAPREEIAYYTCSIATPDISRTLSARRSAGIGPGARTEPIIGATSRFRRTSAGCGTGRRRKTWPRCAIWPSAPSNWPGQPGEPTRKRSLPGVVSRPSRAPRRRCAVAGGQAVVSLAFLALTRSGSGHLRGRLGGQWVRAR
jgi:hypothetical protein